MVQFQVFGAINRPQFWFVLNLFNFCRSKPLDLGPIFALLVYPSSHQISQINDHIASGLSLFTFFCF
jgi:hypothetical protein